MKPKNYFITLLVFLAIDALWLGLVAPRFYQSQIGFLMAETPNWLAAGIFYLLYPVAVTYFVVEPGIREKGVQKAALNGAIFGLVAYATYDLTNLATIKDWPLLVTVIDLIWGTLLTAATSAASVWLGMKWRTTKQRG
jgi:uncharacterized membrane protein